MKRNVIFLMRVPYFHSRSRLSDAVKIAGEPHLIPSRDSINDSCEDVTVLEIFTQQQVQQRQSLSLLFIAAHEGSRR